MSWGSGTFLRAASLIPIESAGYIYRGLGMYLVSPASPKGRRPPVWFLIHLNSGHQVARIKGFVKDAFPVASEIAECADWDFNGLDGWRNQTPDLPRLVKEIIKRNAKRAEISAGGMRSHEIASQISALRA